MEVKTSTTNDLYKRMSGPLRISMTNEYLFQELLKSSNNVLRGLIGALLHLEKNQIVSAEIRTDNAVILEVRIRLKNEEKVNVRLQVINEHYWLQRSILDLCHAFNVNNGKAHNKSYPTILIGLLDFSLDKEYPKFYASHMLMNVKSHRVYSDKLTLNVLELRESALATEEDKAWKIDYWARFFKAQTWEYIKMLAQELPVLDEAAKTIYCISQNEQIRQQCEAREEYYRRQRTTERLIEQQKKELAEQRSVIAEQDQRLRKMEELLRSKGIDPEKLS